jgi:ATP-binding cassette subfamily C protein
MSSVDIDVHKGLRAFKLGIFYAVLFSLALNLLMLTVPLYMAAIYDRVLSSRSQETLLVLTIIAFGAIGLAGVLEAIRQIVLSRTGTRIETTLGATVLGVSLGSENSGDIQGLRDLGQLRQFISSPLLCALLDAPVAPLYFALLFLIDARLGWLATGVGAAILIVALLNLQLSKKPLAEAAAQSAAALLTAQAHVRNSDVVRAMGMFANSVSAWGASNRSALAAYDRAALRNALLNGLTQWMRLALQLGILGYGALLVMTDNMLSAGIIFAASVVSARALAPINQIVGGWRSLVQSRQAWQRVRRQIASAGDATDPMPLPAPRASIAVEKLIYRPLSSIDPILKGISFDIEPEDVVGVIGPSGAGKSTLARLMVGALQPTAGKVRIGGDDLANWPSDALGPFIGYLPQDVELFPGTIATNIARLDPEPDGDKVVAAARLANCHELIQRLPNGYDTVLGPQGFTLSGGQRQRVALARAFYGSPRLAVLDEPNASLDGEGEEALIAALKDAHAAGITCVVITQRPSVLMVMTKVMIVRDGRIEAFGAKEDVLQPQVRPVATEPASGLGGFSTATGRFG